MSFCKSTCSQNSNCPANQPCFQNGFTMIKSTTTKNCPHAAHCFPAFFLHFLQMWEIQLFFAHKKPLESYAFKGFYWRRAWDSNPRYPESTTDFEDDGYRNSLLFLLLSFYICPPANPVISTVSVYRHITFYIILSHRFIGYGCTFPSFLHGLYFTGSPFFLSNSFFGINCLSGIIAS